MWPNFAQSVPYITGNGGYTTLVYFILNKFCAEYWVYINGVDCYVKKITCFGQHYTYFKYFEIWLNNSK